MGKPLSEPGAQTSGWLRVQEKGVSGHPLLLPPPPPGLSKPVERRCFNQSLDHGLLMARVTIGGGGVLSPSPRQIFG